MNRTPEARAAIMAYWTEARRETIPEQTAPAVPESDALIEAVMQHWPDMRPYQHTAEVGEVQSILNGTIKPCVTVTILETDSNI